VLTITGAAQNNIAYSAGWQPAVSQIGNLRAAIAYAAYRFSLPANLE
jgi:hypothetical protein